MGEEFLARIRRTITTHRLLPPGGRLIVAVSGGADSVALLHVLTILQPAWKVTLRIAHLDHGLRHDSREDAAFVRDLAARWRIGASVERKDVATICAREGWSLEDGARRIRYEFLLEEARRWSASRIALGHTADDQAETVLMRLVRGTGLAGLSAIPIRRQLEEIWVVRPLLEVWRQDIVAWLGAEHIPHREDASNADGRFVRNRIRHELLPLLERHYNPNIKVALSQLAEQSSGDYAYLQEAAGRQWKRLVKASGAAAVSIAVAGFCRQPKALQRQLVRRAIQRLRGDLTRFEYRHWLEAERLFTARPVGTVLDLPGGVQLHREPERVVARRVGGPHQQAMTPD